VTSWPRAEVVIPTLYATCGLPFAGKSTIAAALAARLGIPVVRLDVINNERGLGLSGEAIPSHEWDRTYTEAYRRMRQILLSGTSVVYDHVNFTRAERDVVRAIARECGAAVQTIYVPVAVEEARRRLFANRLTRARNDVRVEDFELVVAQCEPPNGEPDVVHHDIDAET
jgi:predicted kinase